MFKRIVCFLLSMLLIVPVASADTDEEIVFHGIPWGISVNELFDQLKERKIPVSSSDIDANGDMRFWGSQFLSIMDDHVEATGHMISIYDYDDRIKIAGYPVWNIDLYAHYGIIDGKLSFDADDSEFHYCSILFAAGSDMVEGVYSDLLGKLTSLYGNCTQSTAIPTSTETYAVWYGANSTAVMLYRDDEYQYVSLYYGKTESEQTLREVRKLVIEHQFETVADDTTGL